MSLNDQVMLYVSQFDKELSKYPWAIELEKKTKVPKTYLAGGVGGVLAILIFFNVWGNLITNLIGFVYPAYASFKAIESPNKEDDVQWLTYWVVFGLLNVIEFFTDILLFWVPFYYSFKTVVILYLLLPQFQGAGVLYQKFVRPTLLKEQGGIDSNFAKIKAKAQQAANDSLNGKSD
jgi:receptor expression-enhancing protein 5/6